MNNGKLRSLSHRLSNKKVVGLIPNCSEVSTLDSKIPKAKPNYNEDIQTNPKKLKIKTKSTLSNTWTLASKDCPTVPRQAGS